MPSCWCVPEICKGEKIWSVFFYQNGEVAGPCIELVTNCSRIKEHLKKIGTTYFYLGQVVCMTDGTLVTRSKYFTENAIFVLVSPDQSFIGGLYGRTLKPMMSSGKTDHSTVYRYLPKTSSLASQLSIEAKQFFSKRLSRGASKDGLHGEKKRSRSRVPLLIANEAIHREDPNPDRSQGHISQRLEPVMRSRPVPLPKVCKSEPMVFKPTPFFDCPPRKISSEIYEQQPLIPCN